MQMMKGVDEPLLGQHCLHLLDLGVQGVAVARADVGLRITSVRMPLVGEAHGGVAPTTAMTSSHSPSISVNMEVVRWGRPESRMTRTASAT